MEIGIGGCECALVAQEMGLQVLGIDIMEEYIRQAHRYGINAECCDFLTFDTPQKWDMIILGDVIEHVADPVSALAKATDLLQNSGVIWISTPNFEASFSAVAGHHDPMRREAAHKNYFSRHSLFQLLERVGLMPVEYRISAHYNGSMEIIALKESDVIPPAPHE